jgi:SPP1 family phage portal protein
MQLNELGELTISQLETIERRLSIQATEYNFFNRYYVGDNPAIMDAKKKLNPPDNRVPSPFGRKLVDTMTGYAAKGGNTTYTTDGKWIDTLKVILDKNDFEEIMRPEAYKIANTSGHAYQILWTDNDAEEIEIYKILPSEGIAVYDDTLKHKMIAFVYITSVEVDDKTTDKFMIVFYKDKRKQYVWLKINDKEQWVFQEDQPHFYKDVPAVEYNASIDKKPLFYSVLPHIDEHDKITSSGYSDERERFANSYMTALKKIDNIIRNPRDGLTDAERIAITKIFDGLGLDGEVKSVSDAIGFVTKPSRGSDTAEAADRFERLIYDFSMVINLNDYRAGTPLAGIAYRLKVMGMEFKAADIDSYFDKGIQRLFTLIGNATEIHKGKPEPVSIKHERNIPKDIEAMIKMVGDAQGIVSKQTSLGWIPSDYLPEGVDNELERIEEEKAGTLPGLEDPLSKPIETGSGADAAASGDVQATALNGAQITGLIDLATAAADGTLTIESAKAIAAAAFPLMTKEELDAIFNKIIVKEKAPVTIPIEKPTIPVIASPEKKMKKVTVFKRNPAGDIVSSKTIER